MTAYPARVSDATQVFLKIFAEDVARPYLLPLKGFCTQ
jgi:hypothetical protein